MCCFSSHFLLGRLRRLFQYNLCLMPIGSDQTSMNNYNTTLRYGRCSISSKFEVDIGNWVYRLVARHNSKIKTTRSSKLSLTFHFFAPVARSTKYVLRATRRREFLKIQLFSKLKWVILGALLDGRPHLTSYDPEIPLLQISRSLKVGGVQRQ